MIAVRTDANNTIAMGHLMRCLSVAQQLQKMNQEVLFVLSESYGAELVRSRGFAVEVLGNDYNDKEAELGQLRKLLAKYDCRVVLVDSYQVTAEYMTGLGRLAKVAYIDDLKELDAPADVVIHYLFGADRSNYTGIKAQTYLLGNRYVPLREEFSANEPVIRDGIENILITTGGTDRLDMAIGALEAIDRAYPAAAKHVVVGRFYDKDEELRRLADACSNVTIYKNISDMWRVMHMCDVAVTAGGTTIMELAAAGVPAVCFAIADNQLPGIMAYGSAGVVRFAGNAVSDRSATLHNIVRELRFLEDAGVRRMYSDRARECVDGQGAVRIADCLVKLQNKDF